MTISISAEATRNHAEIESWEPALQGQVHMRLSQKWQQAYSDIRIKVVQGRELSEKQWLFWLALTQAMLVEKGKLDEAKDEKTNGTVLGMVYLKQLFGFLDRSPGKVRFMVEHMMIEFKYTGMAYTKYPGSYHIKEIIAGNAGERYLGRLEPDGKLQLTAEIRKQDVNDEYVIILQALNADPVKAAVLYGHATNSCSFCARELTDEPSVEAGYGPICADKYGLPWGDKPARWFEPVEDNDPDAEF
jgi:hypothetical protein